jgi:hypothetical protein
VGRMADAVGASRRRLPSFGHNTDFAWPSVEESEGGFAWVVMERGEELERHETRDIDDIQYRILEFATSAMALDWAAAKMDQAPEQRLLWFKRHLELLGQLDPRWCDRKKAQIAAILRTHPPVRDTLGIAAQLLSP